ncbi:hypothetical protein N0V84_000380 [Fusarium piperis]|uniref:Uncharacterized protein n=1 Tax=Fusarium piperis TaxID=1435070 RepID=A0A9W9BU78_9HYPO|nr:hypothetical protein N0V84_000380 [Fusarium piperis]
MSKLVDDVKSGLKGIRGAGDAIRGEVLKATDQTFEKNPDHPTTVESRTENEAIAEKGKRDMRGADEMLARHEWERKGVAPPAHSAATNKNQPVTESDRPAETLHREPGTIAPGEATHYGTGMVDESGAGDASANVSEKHRYA